MSQKIPLHYALPAIILSTLLVAAVIWAWTEPTVAPPGGNVPAPINVSSNNQSKTGSLGIGTSTLPAFTLDVNGSGRMIGGLRTNLDTYLAVNSGNVGIGTTTPAYKLHVVGDINVPSTGFLRIAGDAGSSGQILTRTASGMAWQNATGTGGYWALSGTNIYNTNTGNVGIGTTVPLSPLHVASPASIITLRLSRLNNALDLKHRYLGVNAEGGLMFGKTDDANTWNQVHMRINTDGNVGIGMPYPADIKAKLHIDGVSSSTSYLGDAKSFQVIIRNTYGQIGNFSGLSFGSGDDAYINFIGSERTTNSGHLIFGGKPAGGGTFVERMRITDTGNVGIGTGATAPAYMLTVNGNVGATAFYYTSDISLKENIKPLEDSLAKILQLNGISYQMKETGQERLGFSAQEVAGIFPELINKDKEGLLSIEASGLIAALVEAIKTQQIQIDELKAEITQLKNQ